MVEWGMLKKPLLLLVLAVAVPSLASANPGFSFHEKMAGTAWIDGVKTKISVDLIAAVADVDAWQANADHPATLVGTAKIGGHKLPITGTLTLFNHGMNPEGKPGHFLHYMLGGSTTDGWLKFDGSKFVPDGFDWNLLHDMTTLTGSLQSEFAAEKTLTSLDSPFRMRFEWWKPWILIPFTASFRPTGCKDLAEKVRTEGKFFLTFLGALFGHPHREE